MTENYADLYTDLFVYALVWERTYEVRNPALNEVQAKIKVMLDEQLDRVSREGLSMENYKQTRFAACAWVDELIMNSSWEHREQWQRNLLQTQYYGTTNAGEEFFERLDRLHPEQKGVREIYYLCLCLGFRGRYCWDEDLPTVRQIVHQNYQLLPEPQVHYEEIGATPLVPAAYPEPSRKRATHKAEKTTSRRPSLLLALAPPAVFALLFGVYYYLLSGQTDSITRMIAGA